MSGQVWTAADFDGMNALGFEGGAGSVLAVTAQNPGPDGLNYTADDLVTPMNLRPGEVSVDVLGSADCQDNEDRVRGFAGKHSGGVLFVFADGSTRFLNESIEPTAYRAFSTIKGKEVRSDIGRRERR